MGESLAATRGTAPSAVAVKSAYTTSHLSGKTLTDIAMSRVAKAERVLDKVTASSSIPSSRVIPPRAPVVDTDVRTLPSHDTDVHTLPTHAAEGTDSCHEAGYGQSTWQPSS